MNKTRVCHMSTVHKRNDIRIFHKECRALAAGGYDVTYLTQGNHDETDFGVRCLGSGGLPIKNKIKRMTVGCSRLFKAAVEVNADIYHIHDSELLRYAKKLKKLGKKVIYDSHEHLPMHILEKEWIYPGFRRLISWAAGIFELIAVRYADLVIVVADKTFERFVEKGFSPVKIENFPIFSEFEDIKIDYSYKKEKRKICYSGAVWLERGLDTMCEAAARVNDCIFEIAGRIDHENPEGFIKSFGRNIVYSGYLPRDGVVRLYEESIAGVCLFKPYPNNMIDPPTKIFEYMAAGIPVIASDFDSMKGIVERYDCGICVDPLDTDKISAAMVYLLENPDEAQRMGMNGRDAVQRELNWEKHSMLLLESYGKLMEKDNG
ncbi:MAG: glycosyltransferase [Clostridia bacterium]|nr:glycosyltransferase [Clostridia bacterium]